ncbi:unnamed protein product, partial [Symbiodinium necroappetens]
MSFAAKDLSKVLKHPTSFSCQTRDEELVKWPAWAWEFEQYLGTLDKSFQVDFKRLKDNAKTVVDFSVLTEAEKDRSRIMYGLLASLLNDRLKRLLKTVSDNNGYEAYRLISLELRPSSRTRALALMQTIHNWPVFDSKQGLLAQVVRLEQAMAEYDSIASQAMSDDQRVVSLLRCLTGQLRQHVNLTMEDSWSYAELRSLVARYDASSSKWGASVAAAYGLTEGKGGVLINAAPASSDFIRSCSYGDRQVEEATDGGASASTDAVRRVAYNLDDYDAASSGEIRVVSQCDVCEQCNSGDEGDEDFAVEVVCFPQCIAECADASCLPQSLSTAGVCSGSPVEFFQDAQGNPLMVHGTRRAELNFGNQPSFTETFLVAPHITTPLLAVGKLYRAGFSLQNENGNMSLRSPSGDINIPLYLKQNSLAAKLYVRVIRQDPATVRALTCTVGTLSLPDYFVQISADVFGMQGYGNRFVDITMALPQEGCSFRTTIVKAPDSDEWEILEWCESIVNVDELSALLPGGGSREMIVFATRRVVPPEELGVMIGDGGGEPPSPGSLPTPPAEDADMLESEQQQHGAAPPDQQAELEVDGALHDETPVDDDGSLVVDGTTLSIHPCSPQTGSSVTRQDSIWQIPRNVFQSSSAPRASSVFCFDFSYTSRSDKDEKLCCLVAHDSETKWVQAWPVQSKGGTASRNFMAVEVTKLLSYLGHRRVTLRADPEPSCTALANAIQALRHRIGMETHIEQTSVGEHQSNHAEGAIERIRQLVGTILAELEDKLQVKIKTFDPLHHWCWRHAGWILQRFGVTQNLTPWERVHAAPYGGKLVRFAECVLARVKTATKGKPR